MGQFLPVSLQFGLSAAKETVHSAATNIENKIFMLCFIGFKLSSHHEPMASAKKTRQEIIAR